jgi:hypothetical protein
MSDHSLRDALLKQQNEGTSVETQLNVFNELVQVERRRARRLTIWTLAVWAVWVSMMAVGLGLPMVLQATAVRPPQKPATSTTTTTVPTSVPAQSHPNPGGPMQVAMAILAVFFMVVFFCLPVAGVVLLVMMIVSRRSATMSQIQASLMSIDAQLKLIVSQNIPPAGPQG